MANTGQLTLSCGPRQELEQQTIFGEPEAQQPPLSRPHLPWLVVPPGQQTRSRADDEPGSEPQHKSPGLQAWAMPVQQRNAVTPMVAQKGVEAPTQQSDTLPQVPPLGTHEAAAAGVGTAKLAITGRAAAALPQRARNSRRLVWLATGRSSNPRSDNSERVNSSRPSGSGWVK